MKYMLLVCGDDTADASGMAPVEPWVEDLGDRRVRLHGHRLALPDRAVTVRVRDGEVLRADGPFAETKEYVAGFDVLECDGIEEAIEAAARHPVAAVGALEVRPFWDDEDAEAEIRALDAELTSALRERDVDRMAACYTPDVAEFRDGQVHRGVGALRKSMEEGLGHLTGPVTREVLESHLQLDESVAFAQALVRLRATRVDGARIDDLMHVTTGYRNVGPRWLIAHEHVSPTTPTSPTSHISSTTEERS
ncbi:nuclear transport factor 2 family protein [Streptomyces sp. NPDC098781]|uniref:nuclear transport factor 2 family protein n=1 Tax=Streptomyces sp. NPDC098781 TaxID=3366097 RepID=UPI0038157424